MYDKKTTMLKLYVVPISVHLNCKDFPFRTFHLTDLNKEKNFGDQHDVNKSIAVYNEKNHE